MKKILLLLVMPALLAACSDDTGPKKPSKPSSIWAKILHSKLSKTSSQQIISIKSIDGKELAGAKVLIGKAVNNPFANNFLTANEKGEVNIPNEWNSPQPVTVQADGHIRVTYMNAVPQGIAITLRPYAPKLFELKGITPGHNINNGDGRMDFSLIIPALSKLDVMNFDIQMVMSPFKDKISAMGYEVNIPSNTSLPKQKEKYGIFPVTIEKPIYRVYTRKSGYTRIYAARGSFPFKQVINAMRDGVPFHDLINFFDITGGGIRDINIQTPSTNLDIPVNELNYSQKRTAIAPNMQPNETMVAVSAQIASGLLLPLDIKRVDNGGSTQLNVTADDNIKLVSVLKKSNEIDPTSSNSDRLSVAISDFQNLIRPEFLPIIENPKLDRNVGIILPKVTPTESIKPLATYAVLSEIQSYRQGGKEPEQNTLVKSLNNTWEVYSSDWPEYIELPVWPQNIQIEASSRRWEVSFLGTNTEKQVQIGPEVINSATHATHSSVDF